MSLAISKMMKTSMKSYLSSAVEAAGVALITGIEQRRDVQFLGDLWRHYTGLRAMYDAEPEVNINFTGGEPYDPDYNISIGNLHDDVIQFPS